MQQKRMQFEISRVGKKKLDTLIGSLNKNTVNSLRFARDLFSKFRHRFKIANINTRGHNSCVPI